MQLRNFVRRHKWRLRPFKRAVLPLRKLRRAAVGSFREPPVIVSSTIQYAGPSLEGARQIHSAQPVRFLPHPFMDSEKEATLSEPAWVFELKNIDFWGRYGGSIVTADNCLLADLSPEVWGVENHPIFSRFRLPKREALSGRIAIAVTPEAPGNYYHWLIDLMPRLCLLRSSAGFDAFTRLLINGSHSHYEESSLRAMGVPIEKVFYVHSGNRFHIKEASIPSMDHFSKSIAPWKIENLRSLRDALPRPEIARPRRLYFSRRHDAVRRVINEPELTKVLDDAGFKSVELELHTWPEQIAMFSGAEIVFAPHGAALANTVFCQPGSLVLEVSTRLGYRDYYFRLAASSGLHYQLIEAQPRVAAAGSSFRAMENEDMTVDLNSVRDLLRNL